MKRLHNIKIALFASAALLAAACTADREPSVLPGDGEAALLDLTVSFEALGTRLAELGSPEDMNDDNFGLSHVGLYIYYKTDYDADNLRDPYVRNLKCEIDGNRLVPVLEPGQNADDAKIYIYDRMRLVAFYPYNEEMNKEENFFETKADEEKYPITRNDYSQQKYIPYRATTETNPTIAYYTELTFYPKHTYKVEIVVVSDDTADFEADNDAVVILPNIDPTDTVDTDLDGKREKWYDRVNALDNRQGGSNVRQYVSYIWTKEDGDNNIPQGEILLQAGKLTLIASQDVAVQEQYVYRYGYNMSTGEIFIPTSSNLIWDAPSLEAFRGGDANGYQVCDIDLDGYSYMPPSISGGRFDGGGHKIENLVLDSSQENVGLFGSISNNASICNVNLIDPVITVNSSSPVNVGAICGKVSDVLSEELINEYFAQLPDNLSEVVKQAILADLLADALNSTCRVAACRVENPQITVNAPAPVVGTICGTAGQTADDGTFKAVIWSCYSLGGSIAVNVGNETDNAGGYVGGFCGLNNGRIFSSFTTIRQITFDQDVAGALTPDYTGFTTMGNLFTSPADAGLSDNFSILGDPNEGSGMSLLPGSWPSWSSATPWWPVLTSGWLTSETLYWYDSGYPETTYPILQWERR